MPDDMDGTVHYYISSNGTPFSYTYTYTTASTIIVNATSSSSSSTRLNSYDSVRLVYDGNKWSEVVTPNRRFKKLIFRG